MIFRLTIADWRTQKADAQDVRHDVFVMEQNIPIALEWDQMDEVCLHAIAYEQNGRAIGTGRLLPDGHIGRMAVRKAARGNGVGAAILHALMQEAQKRGDAMVVLNSQTHAEAFYARSGFARDGAEFIEAGIPHIQMRYVFNMKVA